jgi:crotonobetainyl-CoA:carnitine CoA-transferase CaiB-like acyl-CoA transferase
MTPATPATALEGVVVLDLTRYIPGPYCTMLLGDLGADVVKIEEPPFGDATRALPPAVEGDSAAHAALNRNKRSVVVDIRRAEGAEVVRRLASKADVLVASHRPGVLERRGLSDAELRDTNPRLVYCMLTGYGPEGPHAQAAGHDIDYAALGGLLSGLRDTLGQPVVPTTQLADMAGGLTAVIGVLAALHARERTGVGQIVDVSLLQATLALSTVPATRLLALPDPSASVPPARSVGELAGTYACYNVYPCADGRSLAVGALEPKFWEALCRGVGLEEWIPHQWPTDPARRESVAAFRGIFSSRDRDEWVARLRPLDVCVEPVLDLGEALAQAERDVPGSVVRQESGYGSFRTVAPPIGLRGTPVTTRRAAPALGEHTNQVLQQAGYAEAEIAALRAGGVVA